MGSDGNLILKGRVGVYQGPSYRSLAKQFLKDAGMPQQPYLNYFYYRKKNFLSFLIRLFAIYHSGMSESDNKIIFKALKLYLKLYHEKSTHRTTGGFRPSKCFRRALGRVKAAVHRLVSRLGRIFGLREVVTAIHCVDLRTNKSFDIVHPIRHSDTRPHHNGSESVTVAAKTVAIKYVNRSVSVSVQELERLLEFRKPSYTTSPLSGSKRPVGLSWKVSRP